MFSGLFSHSAAPAADFSRLQRASITFREVAKRYGDHQVLNAINLQVEPGEVVAILGPSGSGKSTLIRLINQLESLSGGEILIDGKPTSRLSGSALRQLRSRVGFVFQQFNLYAHLTAQENITLALERVHGWGKSAAQERALALLRQVGLEEKAQQMPAQLSGGQQQRVAIGRALVYNPPVILLDEPLSNLDAKLREEARVFLRELIVKLGLSALMVTHDQNEAMAISDRILLLNNGVIEQQGTPQEMYGSPATLFAAEFMGSNNRLHGKVMALENGRARIEGASWSLWGRAGEGVSVGEPATAVIRVERLRLDGAAQDNSLQLPLLTSMYLGDRWEYLFRTEGDDFPLRAYGTALRDAEHCHLTLPAEDVWIFPQR